MSLNLKRRKFNQDNILPEYNMEEQDKMNQAGGEMFTVLVQATGTDHCNH